MRKPRATEHTHPVPGREHDDGPADNPALWPGYQDDTVLAAVRYQREHCRWYGKRFQIERRRQNVQCPDAPAPGLEPPCAVCLAREDCQDASMLYLLDSLAGMAQTFLQAATRKGAWPVGGPLAGATLMKPPHGMPH